MSDSRTAMSFVLLVLVMVVYVPFKELCYMCVLCNTLGKIVALDRLDELVGKVHLAFSLRVCSSHEHGVEVTFVQSRLPLVDRCPLGQVLFDTGGVNDRVLASVFGSVIDAVVDLVRREAQELTDDQVEAIMATLSASATGTRQLIYTGTPPYPGCPGDVFRRRRTACIDEPGKHDSWHEWSVAADGIAEINVADKGLWYMANPALGIRLDEEFTAEEMRSMSKDGFARERLGWWTPIVKHELDYAIDKDTWNACKSTEPKPEGKTAYGVKFSADGTKVALCGAVIPKDGKARISLIEYKPTGYGISWLADWLNARYNKASCVVIDGRNGVDVLVERISDTWKMKGSVIRPTSRDMIAAVGTMTNAVNEQTVTWFFKQEALKESAVTAVKRPIGGGWGFGGENSAPIEAAALALWGAKTSKRNPAKKMRIG